MNLEEKTNDEILIEIKTMEHEYEAVKNEILATANRQDELLKRLDELDELHNEGQAIIIKRLKL